MTDDKGFRMTNPAIDETQPIRTPRDIPPPQEQAPLPSVAQPAALPLAGAEGPATPPLPSPVVVERAPGCLWAVASAALVVAAVSLLVNLVLGVALLQRRAALLTMMDQAMAALDDPSNEKISFNFPISQTVNFEGDIPFKQDFDFPFKGNVRINTTIRVPVDLGPLGTHVVNVPVDTVVPVDTSVPVHIDQTFHVKMQVPVQMEVPVELSTAQPPLNEWLSKVRDLLALLRSQL